MRLRIERLLAEMGAVAVKDKVYVLPRSERSVSELLDVKREIDAHAGDASIVASEAIDGMSDADVSALFQNARNVDYRLVLEQTHALAQRARGKLSIEKRLELEVEIAGLEARLK